MNVNWGEGSGWFMCRCVGIFETPGQAHLVVIMQEKILDETKAMIPDTEQRLKQAVRDLEAYMVRVLGFDHVNYVTKYRLVNPSFGVYMCMEIMERNLGLFHLY